MITLAIETSIGSGSLSLLSDGTELGCWIGTKSVSKAEELLEEIERLLANHQINKDEINRIAVSKDGGSATGLRIGNATALGLKTAIGCTIIKVPILDCIAADINTSGKVLVAVSGNNKNIYSQIFELDTDFKKIVTTDPEMVSFDDFQSAVVFHQPDVVAVNSSFFHYLDSKNLIEPQLLNAGDNLAVLVGREAIAREHLASQN